MYSFNMRQALLATAGAAVAGLAACTSTPLPPDPAPPVVLAPPVQTTPPATTEAPAAIETVAAAPRVSSATNPRAYRQDAASHIYGANNTRIFKGRLPPMLYAVGVLQVDLDREGRVQKLNWLRAPKHAPEVIAEIERTVRAAAPFPAPARMGKVTWTDTWLWHKDGRFQLDTLTEGQD